MALNESPRPIRLLLVEDDSEDAFLLRDLLAEAPERFEIETVARLELALERLKMGGFQIVLSDLSLPDSHGLETFTALRRAAPSLPIILLSGGLDEALALAMVEGGAQDYLVKGQVNGAILYRSIRYAIRREESERALAAERNLLRSVVDNLREAIYVKDLEGRYLLGNLAHARQLGLATPSEVVGKHTRELFPPESAERFLADDLRVVRDGEAIINRHELAVDDRGNVRWLSTTKVPMRDGAGKIIGLVGIGRDITERKLNEERLAQYTRELREKNAEMEDDLQMAREVQLAFLPQQFPSFPRDVSPEQSALKFYSRYLPATELGGDFFHVMPISDSCAGILICDVMGHGVRAALITAIHRALMEELSEFAAEPDRFLTEMNRALLSILRRTRSPMFASAFYLTVDAASGKVRYANAGHPQPYHVQRGEGKVTHLQQAGPRPGPALGVFEDSAYETQEKVLAPGDLVILFTDGIYEVEDSAGELFEEKELLRVVESHWAEAADSLLDRLLAEVRAFSVTRNFQDDVCLVAVEIAARAASRNMANENNL